MNLPNNIPQHENLPMTWLLFAALIIVILALVAPLQRISIQPIAVQPANSKLSTVPFAAQPVPQAVPVPTPPPHSLVAPARIGATPMPAGPQPVPQPVPTPPGTPQQQFPMTGGQQ